MNTRTIRYDSDGDPCLIVPNDQPANWLFPTRGDRWPTRWPETPQTHVAYGCNTHRVALLAAREHAEAYPQEARR